MFSRKLFFVLGVYSLNSVLGIDARDDFKNDWIESTKLTDWGNWGVQEFCPNGSYVIGFELKIEDHQKNADDTALNGIRLTCFNLNENRIVQYITSSEGPWGFYRGRNDFSKGLANGFELKSDPNQGRGDDAGAVDFNLILADTDGGSSTVKGGELLPFGVWATTKKMCPSLTAICGIQVQIEDNQGGGDDTSLNNVRLACCKVPHPATTCNVQRGTWENVMTCHREFSNCNVKFKTGLITSEETSITSSTKLAQSLGYSVSNEGTMKMLYTRRELNGDIGQEVFNGRTLQSIIGATDYTEEMEWSFQINCIGTAQELVMGCGPFKVKTREYRCVPDKVPDKLSSLLKL